MSAFLLIFALITSKSDSIPKTDSEPLRNPRLLLGIWAAVGEENASFVIDGKKITYPDSFKSFPYFLNKDTLTIQYDDYQLKSLVRLRSPDTLIMIGDEKQLFYRFNKLKPVPH
jgi:hypothetical protein